MGSCISKFGPKKKKNKKQCCQDCSNKKIVHDKVVIPVPQPPSVSSATFLHPIEIDKHVSLLPSATSASASASNASFSSFSMTSSLSTTSSCSSSIPINKDRSFSSEFLKSCVKKNPHIINQNLVQKGSLENSRNPTKMNHHHHHHPPKKRIRSNSPTIIRQKSFRKEPSWNQMSPSPNRTFSTAEPSWNLRSPSQSRRFSGDQSLKDSILKAKMESYNKRGGVISKASLLHNPQTTSSSLKKQTFRSSPVNQMHQLKSIKSRYNPQMNSRIDECEDEEDKDKLNQDVVMMDEDINNPQIALDCFIFL